VLSFGVIGISNSKPFAHLVGFQIQDTTTLAINILEDFCPGNCPNGVRIFWKGRAGAISKYMKQPESKNYSSSILIERLIDLEIQDEPEYVGGPVDIIEISNNKKIWHRKKLGCPIILE